MLDLSVSQADVQVPFLHEAVSWTNDPRIGSAHTCFAEAGSERKNIYVSGVYTRYMYMFKIYKIIITNQFERILLRRLYYHKSNLRSFYLTMCVHGCITEGFCNPHELYHDGTKPLSMYSEFNFFTFYQQINSSM